MIRDILPEEKAIYNSVVSHPLQSYEWGEFRKKTGIKVIRKGVFEKNKLIQGFTLTIHPLPKTKLTIGYMPKCLFPNKQVLSEITQIGKEENCIFIQLEPNTILNIYDSASNELIKKNDVLDLTQEKNILTSAHPLFTKYTFLIDLKKSDDELLEKMHSKTRYNIKVAKKHEVKIVEDDDFEAYWQLMLETTKRQKFYAHSKKYHKMMWETLKGNKDGLKEHLLIAKYLSPIDKQNLDLAAWILFEFKDTLYYPYGASSSRFRNVMASNLMMWEAIQFGKKHKLQTFDLWGALGPKPDTSDAWYGFHRLKLGYNPLLIEFIGSYDLVIKQKTYLLYKVANKLRWMLLRFKI